MKRPWNYHNVALSPEVYSRFLAIQTSMGSPKSSDVMTKLMDAFETFKVKPKCPTCGRITRKDGKCSHCIGDGIA